LLCFLREIILTVQKNISSGSQHSQALITERHPHWGIGGKVSYAII
jgi:hypothetical protein